MECSIAIQVLPMDAASDEETCRVVDAVIAHIDASGLDYFVGPFETCIEGSYAACMEVLAQCQTVASQAGCGHVLTYAKINYRPGGTVMSAEGKIAKYHEAGATRGHNTADTPTEEA